ncbi:MAG: DUF4129 domain-containing protein [Ornithinimicrobium sp.]|uniref:DUF4129 domain-containing protein n=1 Tax=Ornithinimicrobium sp. TaxID=1977084 RepID=UPI003D9AC8F2
MTRAQRRRAAVVVLAASGFVVLIWGVGADAPVLRRPSSILDLTMPEGPTLVPDATPAARPAQSEGSSSGMVDPDVLLLVALFAVALMIGLLVRWLLTREDDSSTVIDTEDALDALVESTATDPDRLRTEGEPRNAVVACWVALEDGVARAGLQRSPAETSVDLATRVLARWQVDPQATAALGVLYREARFSRHPVTEQERDQAVAALEQINADLRAARDRAPDRAREQDGAREPHVTGEHDTEQGP